MPTVSASVYLLTSAGNRYRALNPSVIEEYLTARRLPVPFLGKANSFLANVDRPGCGWLLLPRSVINAVDGNALDHSLVFQTGSTTAIIQYLHIYNAVAVSGTQNQGSRDCFLVEFRDRRELCKWTVLDKSYNVRNPDWASTPVYLTSTTNGGTAWTWATMIANIWTNISPIAGALTTTLMEVPTSNPENFVFRGVSALEALEQICKHTNNHLLLKRDGTFHIVAQSNSDTYNTNLINVSSLQALNPSSPQFNDGVRVPNQIKVFFPKLDSAFQNSTDSSVNNAAELFATAPVYSVTVTTTAVVPGIETIDNTIGVLHDSLPARYDELGVIQNAAALSTQADKRVLEFIAALRNSEPPLDNMYHGAVEFQLGAAVERIHWYDFGDGIRTQAMFSPKRSGGAEKAFSDVNETPAVPDLARWHLPFERFAVGYVYNTAIAADNSGLVRILYGTRTSTPVTTWAATGLPHEVRAYDVYHRSYAVNDRVVIMFHRQTSRWIIIGALSRDVIRFELSATLALKGHAKAELLDDSWVGTGTDIEVYDPYQVGAGMWAGVSGYQGLAIKRPGTFTDVDGTRETYDIVWMEQTAQVIQFTSTERMGATTAGQMAVTVNWYDNQGRELAGSIIVRDPQGQFPDIHSGAKGTAVYDYHNGYYRIVSSQRIALFATATLTSDNCADSNPGITTFAVKQTGDYVGSPGTTPTTASNPLGDAGVSGDTVLLRRTDNGNPNPAWEIVAIEKHSKTVIVDLQVSGLTIQKKEITIYTEVCTTTAPSWTTWHTGDDCTP